MFGLIAPCAAVSCQRLTRRRRHRGCRRGLHLLAVRPRANSALQPSLPYPNSCQGTSPHQQGRGTKVSEPYNVGIDVSIDRLDVAVRPGGRAFCVWSSRSAAHGASAGFGASRRPAASDRSSYSWAGRTGRHHRFRGVAISPRSASTGSNSLPGKVAVAPRAAVQPAWTEGVRPTRSRHTPR